MRDISINFILAGMNSWEPVTTVAVKMVKPQADITYLKVSTECPKTVLHLLREAAKNKVLF